MLCIKFCQRQDLNRGRRVSEATAVPTEPPPLPFDQFLSVLSIVIKIGPWWWSSGGQRACLLLR